MPLRSACYERWVTEPDNTTNCSIFEEIKHCVCLKFHYLFAFFPPPLINLALYAKQLSSSRVESNKLRLCESCKVVALLCSWTSLEKDKCMFCFLYFASCTLLHLKTFPFKFFPNQALNSQACSFTKKGYLQSFESILSEKNHFCIFINEPLDFTALWKVHLSNSAPTQVKNFGTFLLLFIINIQNCISRPKWQNM